MRVVVLNGSPSGNRGITAHYVKYLGQQFPEHQFHAIEAARSIHGLERDGTRLAAIIEQLGAADLVLWAYPVYFMLVSAQLKRFIELLLARAGRALAGKVASSLSTSAHHYDHTAHDYLQGVCADLGMTYVHGYAAGSEDLLSAAGRRNLLAFARELFRHAEGETPVDAPCPPIVWTPPAYAPALPPAAPHTGQGRIVVISDAAPADENLRHMIAVFERSVTLAVDRIELGALKMQGGCLGCMRCFDDGRCQYQDEYASAFDQRVLPADVVIYAGAVRDRFFSARMKTFVDRYFSNGHRPVLAGKLMGYLVSGPLQQLGPLREFVEVNIELSHCHRLGVVSDESRDSEETTRRLQSMARAVGRWLEERWHTPPTFRGHAADKNFRDLVYNNKGIMAADHRFYAAHGRYDYPHKNVGRRLFNGLLLLSKRIPAVRSKVQAASRVKRVQRFQDLLDRKPS